MINPNIERTVFWPTKKKNPAGVGVYSVITIEQPGYPYAYVERECAFWTRETAFDYYDLQVSQGARADQPGRLKRPEDCHKPD